MSISATVFLVILEKPGAGQIVSPPAGRVLTYFVNIYQTFASHVSGAAHWAMNKAAAREHGDGQVRDQFS